MKKLKFYFSLLKERDWLEEMARKGYLLKNITMGIWYEFEETTPCEKVYEIESFACDADADREELCAKERAFEIARETGWEIATHDEAMNYYFVKDRAGDDSDEFYEDETSRRKKAEAVRKRFAVDTPKLLLSMLLFLSVIYIPLLFMLGENMRASLGLHRFYFALVVLEILIVVLSIYSGEILYKDMSLSREEWEQKKKYGEKKSFRKAQELLAALEEKDRQGLKLVCFEDGSYQFTPTNKHYRYYLDTKRALVKRCKERGDKFSSDRKDISRIGMAWQEQSMKEAGALGLEPVALAEGTMIYRRKAEDSELRWNEDIVYTTFGADVKTTLISFGALFLIGFVGGFVAAIFLH